MPHSHDLLLHLRWRRPDTRAAAVVLVLCICIQPMGTEQQALDPREFVCKWRNVMARVMGLNNWSDDIKGRVLVVCAILVERIACAASSAWPCHPPAPSPHTHSSVNTDEQHSCMRRTS